MFSGIVEEAGTVVEVKQTSTGYTFVVESKTVYQDLKIGDSVASNGCCLTVVEIQENRLRFDLLKETWERTNLKNLAAWKKVNLERSLAINGRLGGHFVSGHVDETGIVTRWEKSGTDYVLEVEVPSPFEKYLVPKGSISIDGISLTVGPVEQRNFSVWIIPHTYEVTSLCERQVGDRVNLEFDMIAKYVEKLISYR